MYRMWSMPLSMVFLSYLQWYQKHDGFRYNTHHDGFRCGGSKWNLRREWAHNQVKDLHDHYVTWIENMTMACKKMMLKHNHDLQKTMMLKHNMAYKKNDAS